jgi:integrase
MRCAMRSTGVARMPSGACVIEYEGKRGKVFRIKYADADGKQVMETLGPERGGWTRRKAEAELRERLVNVEKRGWRKPAPLNFSGYAATWLDECAKRRAWKPSTLVANRNGVERLEPFFGHLPLAAIRPRDVAEYVREALAHYHPKTVNFNLNLLYDVFKTAKAEELIDSNPAEGVERPRVRRRQWRILKPEEVARIAQAFDDDQARLVFLTLILTGVRRSELQALRWRDVDLIESVLRIRESKTEEGIRSIALSATLADALWQRRRVTAFQGDNELVFCHPKRGSKIDHEWFAGLFRSALKAAGIEEYLRPFHDLRHASLTNGAAAGEGPLELMTRAGHRSMSTTKQYLHLAGATFPDAAAALEQRLLAGRTFYPSEVISDDASEAEARNEAVS